MCVNAVATRFSCRAFLPFLPNPVPLATVRGILDRSRPRALGR